MDSDQITVLSTSIAATATGHSQELNVKPDLFKKRFPPWLVELVTLTFPFHTTAEHALAFFVGVAVCAEFGTEVNAVHASAVAVVFVVSRSSLTVVNTSLLQWYCTEMCR